MTSNTEILWNAITDSAKKKFDYNSFEEHFSDVDENLADNLLFKIIIGFASEKSTEIISLELFNELMLIGFIWELKDIQDFIKEKQKLLKIEIYSSQLAISLLEDGNDPLTVLHSIKQLLV